MIPDAHASELYRKQINALSLRFGTPRFEPHITLGRHPGLSPSGLFEHLRHLFSAYNSLSIETDYIRCSDHPYQNLVHQCIYEPVMNRLYADLADRAPGFIAKKEHHVSLLYGTVECSELEQWIPVIEKKVPGKFSVAEFRIVGLEPELKNWKTLYSQSI